jgi:hypothetical protein
MKKNDTVLWRVTTGGCSLEYEGTVKMVRRNKHRNRVYVVFDARGGGWYGEDELILKEPAQ